MKIQNNSGTCMAFEIEIIMHYSYTKRQTKGKWEPHDQSFILFGTHLITSFNLYIVSQLLPTPSGSILQTFCGKEKCTRADDGTEIRIKFAPSHKQNSGTIIKVVACTKNCANRGSEGKKQMKLIITKHKNSSVECCFFSLHQRTLLFCEKPGQKTE